MGQAAKNGTPAFNDYEGQPIPDSNPARKDLITLDSTIGLPPSSQGHPVMSELQWNAIPILTITPCEPDFEAGMTLFRANPVNEKYIKMVQDHGYNVSSPVRIAFIPDTPVSESITNEYGESFLNKMTDVVSSGISEMNQIFGGRTITESLGKGEAAFDKMGGVAGTVAGTAFGAAKGAATGVQGFANAISKGAGDLANKLMAGARIDFPFIWKNSSYSMTTSVNVRLYNPTPKNDFMHNKYIVGPLVALLSLATPISEHMNVYSWPFLHKIKCKGYFNIEPGTITSMSITRGAENQISFGQRPSLVDVRIEFGSLHSVMLNSADPASASRPSIAQLKNILLEEKYVFDMKTKLEPKNTSEVTFSSKELEKNIALIKKSSYSVAKEANEDPVNRVSKTNLDKYNKLNGMD